MFRTLRKILVLLLALAVSLGAALVIDLAVVLDQDQLRARLEGVFARVLAVPPRFEGVRVRLFHGLQLDGLRVDVPMGDATRPFLEVRSIRLTGSILDLLAGEPTTLVLEGPRIHLEQYAWGEWNFQRVLAAGSGGGGSRPDLDQLPRVRLVDAEVIVSSSKESAGAPQRLRLPAMDLTVSSGEVLRLAGELSGDFFERGSFRLEGTGDALRGHAVLRKVALKPGLRESLPHGLAGAWDELQPEGYLDLEVDADFQAGRERPLQYEALMKLFGVRIKHRKRPWELKGLRGDVRIRDGRLYIQELTAAHGPCAVRIAGELTPGKPDPGGATVTLTGLPLDGAVYEALEENERKVWDTYRPSGSVDVDIRLKVPRADGRRGEDVWLDIHPREMHVSPRDFPLPVVLTQGQIHLFPGGGALKDLRGTVPGGTVTVTGTVQSVPGEGPEQDRFDFLVLVRDLTLGDRLRAALPPDMLRIWDELRPSGRADATLRLSKEPGVAPRRSLVVDFRDTRVEYLHFPYPVEGLSGSLVSNDDAVLLKNVVSAAGPQVKIEGTLWRPRKEGPPGYDLLLSAREVPVDHRLLAAVDPETRKLIREFRLQGRLDATAMLVRRDEDGQGVPGARPRAEVDLRLVDCRLDYRPFPYPVEAVHGRIQADAKVVRFSDFTGRSGPALFTADGTVPAPGVQGPSTFTVRGEGLPLDRRLRDALDTGATQFLDELRAVGSVDATATLTRGPGDADWNRSLRVLLNHLAIRPIHLDYPVSEIQGALVADAQGLRLEDVHGLGRSSEDYPPAEFRLSGRLAGARTAAGTTTTNGAATPAGSPPAHASGMDLRLEITGLPLDDRVRRLLDKGLGETWDAWQPQGSVDLAVDIVRPEGQVRETSWTASITGQGLALVWSSFPYALENVACSLLARPRQIRVLRFEGEHGSAHVSADGTVFIEDAGPRAEIDLHWEHLPLEDPDFLAALPPETRAGLTEMEARGPMDGHLLLRTQGRDELAQTQYQGEVVFGGVDMTFGLPIQSAYGRVRLAGLSRVQEGHDLSGELDLAEMRILDKEVRGLTGRLRFARGHVPRPFLDRAFELPLDRSLKEELSTRRPHLVLEGLDAAVLGGRAQGSLDVFFSQPSVYAVDLAIHDGRLEPLLADRFQDVRTVTGAFRGDVHFAGLAQDQASMRGRGRLRIRQAHLWDLPAFTRLLNVIAVGRPERAVFDEADVDFRIGGASFLVDSVQFKSNVLSLAGRGRVGFDGGLNLSFITELGKPVLDDIPVVGDIWSFIKGNLLRVEMRGTLNDPVVQPVVAAPVTEPLRRVFGEHRDDD